MSVDRAVGLARRHAPEHVADGQGLRALGLRFALPGDSVCGLSGLRDEQRQRPRIDQRVAIAELRRVVHLDRHARQPLDHDFSRQARVARRPRGDNLDVAK